MREAAGLFGTWFSSVLISKMTALSRVANQQ